MLWLPYILLTLVLVILLLVSFINFHFKFRHRYQKRKQEGMMVKSANKRALVTPLQFSVHAGLFSLPPPGSSILPTRGMIPIPEEDHNGRPGNSVSVDMDITQTPVIPLQAMRQDYIAPSNGRHQSLLFTRRTTNACHDEQESSAEEPHRWVSVHSKPMRRMSITSTSSVSDCRTKRASTSKSSASSKLRTGLGLFSSGFSKR
ncbi:hypothetical protein CAPTEDRAFT_220378 [Capitella teleta]|uniref:Uncharacterized protein n=1 Tax=Capitella teleta TaxID=283909 RepID=R7UTG3_CAPTE|nr:hypothetical protein CAPTEDRAFT_220378 [Capitella teleta]|eukprot:ELU07207.1 hypothetical protein CAPTEDRAFT_220378 [Capitella teleta]